MNALPTPSISGNASACTGVSQTYSTASVAGNSYSWSVKLNGNPITFTQTNNSITVTYTTSGTGEVSVTETNGTTGCSKQSASVFTVVTTMPTPGISGVTSTCAGSTRTYSTANVAGNSYTWTVVPSGTQFTGQGTNSIVVTWGTASGSVQVTERAGGNSNCTVTTAAYPVTVNALPTPGITGAASACVSTTATTAYTVTTPTTGSTYTWQVAGGVISGASTGTSVNVIWNTVGGQTLRVTETTSANCTGFVDKTVQVNPVLIPTTTGSTVVCAGDTKQYSITNVHTGSTYLWTVTGGSISGSNSSTAVTVVWNGAGTGVVSVAETSTGCVGTSTPMNVTINALPTPSVTSSTGGLATVGVCAGSTHTYSTQNNIGSTYLWTITGGTATNGLTSASVTILWGNAGTGSIKVKETNTAGCVTETTASTITVNALPTPSVTGNASACTGVSQTYSTASVAGNSYSWSVKLNGNPITFTQTNNSITVTYTTSGTGEVSVTETNGTTGCSKQSASVFTVVTTMPTPGISGVTSTCAGSTRTYSTASVAGNSYTWTVVPSGTQFTGQGTNSISVTWGTASGSVQVTERAGGNSNCTVTTAAYAVTVNPLPTPGITGASSACVSTTATTAYTVTTPTTGSTYVWAVAGGVFSGASSGTSVNVIWNTAGVGTLGVTETTSAGCSGSTQRSVTVNPTPQPVVVGVTTVCAGTSQTYNLQQQNAGSAYNWAVTGGAVQGGTTGTSVTVLWNTAGAGTVSVTETALGCSGTSAVKNVTINAVPTPSMTSSTNGLATVGVCAGTTHTYSTQNNIGSTYTWTVTGGVIQSGGTSATMQVLWNGTTSGTIKVRETNAANCSTETSVITVPINPVPTPSITGTAGVCVGATGTYSTAFTAGRTYNWTVTQNGSAIGFTTGANAATITVQWTASGAGQVQVVESVPSTGCSGTSAMYNVSLNPVPTPSIVGNASACTGVSTTYSTAQASNRAYVWTVTPTTATVQGQGTNSITVTFTQAGTGSISLVETNTQTGCSTSATPRSISVGQTPAPVISGASSVCNTSTTQYTTANTTGSTYNWTVTGGTITSGNGTNSVQVQWSTLGQQSVNVTETNNGCVGVAQTFNVTVNLLPSPTVSGAVSVCAGANAIYTTPQIAGATYVWSVTNGILASSNGVPQITANWNTVGTGTVKVTVTTNAGCTGTSSNLNVTVNPIPTPLITSSTNGIPNVCVTSTHTYSTPLNGSSTYQWSLVGAPTGTTSSVSNNVITVTWGSTTGTASLTVLETTAAGCTANTTKQVVVNPLPNPVLTGVAQLCAGQSGTYGTAAVSGDIYVWNVSGGSITQGTGTNVITVLWGTSGIGTVSVVETSGVGCSKQSSTYNVTVNANPTPSISSSTGGLPVVCMQSVQTYQTNNITGNSYLWTVQNGTIQQGQGTNAIIVKWVSGSTGTITVKETVNATQCSSTVSTQVTINPLPTPSVSGVSFVCAGTTQSYSTPSQLGRTYNWTVTGGTFTGSGNQIAVTWGAAGTGSVRLVETITATGCSAKDSIASVTIVTPPAPSITGPTTACTGSNAMSTMRVTVPVSSNLYTWSATGGGIYTGQGTPTAQIQWNAAGTQTVTVTERNTTLGCETTTTYTVTVRTVATPVISGLVVGCVGQTSNYTVQNNAGSTYNWTVTSGTIEQGQGSNAVVIRWGANSVGTIRVTETNNGCSAQSLPFDVSLITIPPVSLTGNAASCQGAKAIYSVPFTPGVTYVWNVTGGSITQGQGTNNLEVTWGNGSQGIVQLSVSSPLSTCTAQGSLTVTLNPSTIPVVQVLGNNAICEGETVILAAPSGFAKYFWSPTGEPSSSIIVDKAGAYFVTVTSNNGCVTTSLPVSVSVMPKPISTVSASGPLQFCQGGSVTLTAASGGLTYRWSNGATTQSITATQSGSYFVTITGTNGCKATSAIMNVVVSTAPKPQVTANGPTTFCDGGSVTLDAGAGYTNYLWSNGATTRTIAVTQSGSYLVVGTLSPGCLGTSDAMVVTVNGKPTASITANGPTTFCDGNTVQLAAPAGMQAYEWSNGSTAQTITVSVSGSFTVKVTNINGCSAVSAPTVITVNPIPSKPTITVVNNTLNTGAASEYQWILNGSDITGASQQSYTATQNGLYKVRIKNSNGCENTSDALNFTISSVIEDGETAGLVLQPNPATDNITFSIVSDREEIVTISILNLTGQEVIRKDAGAESGVIKHTLNLADVASGVYTLRLQIGSRVIARTFVVQK